VEKKRKDGPGSFAHTAKLKLAEMKQRKEASGIRS